MFANSISVGALKLFLSIKLYELLDSNETSFLCYYFSTVGKSYLLEALTCWLFRYQASWLKQFFVLFHRAMLSAKRDKMVSVIRIMQSLVS